MPYKNPEIAKQKAAERYLRNIEKRKEKLRQNYLAKREERIKKAKEYTEANKEKTAEYQAQYRSENKESQKEYRKEYYAENREEMIRKAVDHQRKNMDKLRVRQIRYAATEKGKIARMSYRNNRRAREKNARLGNLFLKETLAIYKACSKMRKEGLKMEVDHIVPICHPNVCGLHVPWNLRIILSKENRVKGNSH